MEALYGTIILGIVGIIVTWYHENQRKKLQHNRLLKDLFTEFNTRYNDLQDKLYELRDIEREKLTPEQKENIYKYFDLCAEEYFWYKNKSLNDEIWKAWNKGMNRWYARSEAVKTLWIEEKENDSKGYISYYLKSWDDDPFSMERFI